MFSRSLVVIAFVAAVPAYAAPINVLWTSGNSTYDSRISTLAAGAGSYDPGGDGSLDWNLTLWDNISAIDFSLFDVFVIGTSNNGFSTGIDHSGVLNNKAGIEAARGSRTFISGQDADYHWVNNSPGTDNGPRGFLINAVNWAASGTGLGIVSMTDGWAGTGSTWWLNDNSFLKAELDGYATYFQSESVRIGNGQGTFPVNEGLTSAGLSNWGTSSHSGFNGPVPGYTTINFEFDNSLGRAITIVTEGREGGGTGGGDEDPVSPVPVPAAGWMLMAALAALTGIRRRRV